MTTVVKAPVIGPTGIAPKRRRPENNWEVANDDFGSNNVRGQRRLSTHRDTTDTSVAGTTSEGPRRRRIVVVLGRGSEQGADFGPQFPTNAAMAVSGVG